MKLKTDIKPITYLKNHAADVIEEVHTTGRTIVITQHGEAKAVVMDVDAYDRMQEALAMLRLVGQSETDRQSGRVVSSDAAFELAHEAVRARRRRG